MIIDIPFPKDLKSRSIVNTLPTIQENREMSFNMNNTNSWQNGVQTSEFPFEFKPYDRLNFQPTICNWFDDIDSEDNSENYSSQVCHCDAYNYHHDEDYHYEEDTSPFLNPMGQRVRYGDYIDNDNDIGEVDPICSSCHNIQDDNILLTCCRNQHYLCTECFYQEKRKEQRQNAEFERSQRTYSNNNQEQLQRYQFVCPECDTVEKINFKITYPEYSHNLEIIQVYK